MPIAPGLRAFRIAPYSRYRRFSRASCVSAMPTRVGIDITQHFRPAQCLHLAEDPFAPLLNVPGWRRCQKTFWVRQYGGEHGAITAGKSGRGLVKEPLRGGFGAVGAVAELGDVQIDFQDAPLRP